MTDDVLHTVHAVPGAWLPRTQTWLWNELRFLPAGVRAHVVCARRENAPSFPLPSVQTVDDDATDGPRRCWGSERRRTRALLADVLRRTGAPVLHSHFGPEGCRNARLVRRIGCRHVVTFYGYDVNCLPRAHPRWRRRYASLFRDVDLVLAEGEHMARCLVDLGAAPSHVRVHRLGVDLGGIPFAPRGWDGRRPLRVLLAAAFREKKGLPLAIEALGRVRDEVDLAITIVGDATAAPASQAEKKRVLEAIDRAGLADRVRRLGFLPHDELLREAADHHLYLAPSRTAANGDTEGGAPVALIELAASGLPVVSTRHCDIPGVVIDGLTGRLAAEGDPDDLEATLRAMLDDAPRWPDMARAARAWITARFDAARQGDRLAAHYRSLVEPTASRLAA